MSQWIVRNRTGRWYLTFATSEAEGDLTITGDLERAARFPTRERAEQVRNDVDHFRGAYELVEVD